jgi:RHS repeat-associated protein
VTGPEHARTSAVLHQRSWVYEAAGSPAWVTDAAEGTRRLTHDARGRVTAVTAEGWSERYGYDAAGNITHAEDSRAAQDGVEARELTGTLLRRAGRTSYAYDGQGRLVKAVRRTISGTERVWTYAYDAQDRLTEAVNPAGERWRYVYDPLGRRIAKRRLGAEGETLEETRFTWEGSVIAEQEHVHAGNDVVTTTVWDYEPGSWAPLAQDRLSYHAHVPQELIDRQFHAIVTDLVGTPTELVTAEGDVAWRRRTDLWGRSVLDDGAAACPLGFPGQYHDPETGLAYNNKRYYDPDTGRYTTPDPLGLDPAPNHHAYVPDPLVSADPLGLDAEGGFTDLYHGTDKAGAAAIRKNGVDPAFGPRPMDFGNGFYTTRDFRQAKSWADRKPGGGVVLHFKVPNSELSKLNTKTFSGDSQELRNFVSRFRGDRSGRQVPSQDVVEGPMLMNPRDFRAGGEPSWRGNQVVFFRKNRTGTLLDSSLQ